MKRFKSVGQAQRFLAAFGAISPHFRPAGTGCRHPSTGR